MNEFIISFSLGIFGLSLLFLISLAIVLSAKAVIVAFTKYSPKKVVAEQPPPEKPAPKKRERAPKSPPIIRTIEIDPSQVDRIYVKKAQ